MTRAEHLQWAKDRALAYLKPPQTEDEKRGVVTMRDGRDDYYRSGAFHQPSAENLRDAISSFISDLSKHAELASHPALMLIGFEMMGGGLKTADGVRRFVEGTN